MRAEYTLVGAPRWAHRSRLQAQLSDFDDPKELPIELLKQGLITGKVVDGSGEPLGGARIKALNTPTGRIADPSGSAETNDLGASIGFGIDPGTYRLRATYRAGREHELDSTPLTIATAFFGSAGKPIEIAVTTHRGWKSSPSQ